MIMQFDQAVRISMDNPMEKSPHRDFQPDLLATFPGRRLPG